MNQHIENTHAQSTEPVGEWGTRELGHKPWASKLFKLSKVKLGTNKVSANEEAVGQHLQETGRFGEGSFQLIFGEDRFSLELSSFPVIYIKR